MSVGTFSNLPLVRIGDVELPRPLAAAVDECWVELSVNLPAAFHIGFRDPHRLLLTEFPMLTVGAPVSICAVADGSGFDPPLVNGVITGLEADFDGTAKTTVVRGLDHAFRLMRGRRVRGYPNATAASIARTLTGLNGVRVGRIEPTDTVYDLATQPNISDWDFLQRLADDNGVEMSFDSRGLFQFRRATPAAGAPLAASAKQSPYVVQFGTNVLRCRSGVTAADQVASVGARGWDVRAKETLTARVPAVANPSVRIGTTPARMTAPFGPATLVETSRPLDTHAEVRATASALADDVTSTFAELEVAVRGEPALRPGSPVALERAGRPFDGGYTVTSARHTFARGGRYETWVGMTGRQVRSLYGLAAGAQPAEQRIPGVVNALVTDVKDPLGQGRVKLRFPWLDDTYTTDWVRTVQAGGVSPATAGRGATAEGSPGAGGVISPEVGDEVLVAFDRGCLDHPYVLGGLYNGRNRPSPHDVPLYGTDGRINRRSLVSRSGHRVELLDAVTPPVRGVRLRSGDGALTVFLDATKTQITVHSNGSVDIHGTAAVNVTSDGPLNLRGTEVAIQGETVAITGTGGVNISGGTSLNLAAAQTRMEAGMLTYLGTTATVTSTVNILGTLTVDGVPLPVPG